jgi:Tol biopolymer transport system component
MRLAYTQTVFDYNIWRMSLGEDLSGRELRAGALIIASTHSDYSPDVSPDGGRIAFASDRSGTLEIWMCDWDGSNAQQLTLFGRNPGPEAPSLYGGGSPRWSPDGSQVAYSAFSKGMRRVYVLGLQGGPGYKEETSVSEEWRPAWSRDGRWLYFSSNRSGIMELWKRPAGGSGVAVQVTRGGGFDGFESTNGALLFFLKSRNGSTLWSMPVGGGPESVVLEGVHPFWWATAEKGIYFVDFSGETPSGSGARVVRFFSFETRRTQPVGVIARFQENEFGLSVSHDGQWLLWSQLDRATGDIILVERFQ